MFHQRYVSRVVGNADLMEELGASKLDTPGYGFWFSLFAVVWPWARCITSHL